jgi:UDP-glucose 4-epimerase
MAKLDHDGSKHPRKVALVTGGTGVVGPALVQLLLQNGLEVRALVLSENEVIRLPQEVMVYHGDIRDPASIQEAVQGSDVIFHLAAKLHIYDPKSSFADEYEQINVEGTRHLADAAINFGVSRIVFFSTVNVYGVGDSEGLFTETSDLSPQTLYSSTKSRAEKIILSARSKKNGKPLGVVLRLAAVYGPTMKGNYIRLLKGLYQGWFLPIGSAQNRRALIFIDDAVQAAFIASDHPAAVGNVYNITDGRVYSLLDIIHAMCAALNRRPPRIHLPAAPIRFSIGLLEDLFHLLGRRFPLGRQTIDGMLEDRAVSGDKIQQELGFRPQIELEEGWCRVVNEVYK